MTLRHVSAAFAALILLLATPAIAGAQEPDEATLALGRDVFTKIAQPQCAICHTLADAGATGAVGPDLDTLRPDADRVRNAVVNGIGPMPANEILTDEQVEAVALYVSTVAGAE